MALKLSEVVAPLYSANKESSILVIVSFVVSLPGPRYTELNWVVSGFIVVCVHVPARDGDAVNLHRNGNCPLT